MSERGIQDPLWLSRKIIEMAHPVLLRKAVIAVIDHLEEINASGTSPYEIIDRLVQVSATGEYKAPPPVKEVYRKVINLEDGKLTPEQEQEIHDFIDALDGIPTAEKTDEDQSYEDFLRGLGIPPEKDEDDKE